MRSISGIDAPEVTAETVQRHWAPEAMAAFLRICRCIQLPGSLLERNESVSFIGKDND